MVATEELIIWVVLSPIALFTCITCIVILSHYQPYYHGTDIAIFSIFLALSLRIATVILIPAILGLSKLGWSLHICNFYVWIFVTLHIAELLSFVSVSIHWMTIPRAKTGKEIYNSAKYMKIVIFLVWFSAAIVGLVPVIEWSSTFQTGGECRFLPYNLGDGFSVFFIIIGVFSFIMALICTADTMVLFKYMKQIAVDKYQAGRFYLPSSASVAKTASETVHARYNELAFSSDLCRLVVVLIIGAFTLNHIPLTVIEFLQLVSDPDHEFLENIILWLILFEGLILPQCVWFLSRRYRHALVYMWKVYIMRDPTAKEEDPTACTLQSYTRKIRDVDGKSIRVTTIVNGRNTILPPKDHIYSNGDVRKMNGATVVIAKGSVGRNGRPTNIVVTDIDDGMAVATNNYSPTTINEKTLKTRSDRHNSDPVSPSMSSLSTPSHDIDLTRSASSNSRKDWKEQMRRKHLPPIFVNEAFDHEQTAVQREVLDESHYYVSSDYHPDYLMNSLPRSVKAQESESEGASNRYNDDDIDHILELEKDGISLSSEQCLVIDISDDESEKREPSIQDETENAHLNINSTQTAADLSQIFQEDYMTPSPPSSTKSPLSIRSDSLSNASEKSVTIEPYTEARRPPWMDMDETSTSFQSSDLQSGDSRETTDYDIDRGFEEALEAGYASSMAGYSTMGLVFDSIKEEPEDLSDNETHRGVYSPFKTQAVSTESRLPPQTPSDNPFDNAPLKLPPDGKTTLVSKNNDEFSASLTNGYGESAPSFNSDSLSESLSESEKHRHSPNSKPLVNGYDESVTSFQPVSPTLDGSRGRNSVDSNVSQTSITCQEVANISKAALMKQQRVNGFDDAINIETSAYF